jgi:hypothetical protein
MIRLSLLLVVVLFACGDHQHDPQEHNHVVPHVILDANPTLLVSVSPPMQVITADWSAPDDVPKRAIIPEFDATGDASFTVYFSAPIGYLRAKHDGPRRPMSYSAGNEDISRIRFTPVSGEVLEWDLMWSCGRTTLRTWTP